MKKKFLSLLLALAMCLSLSVPAWAAETTSANIDTVNIVDNNGVILEFGLDKHNSSQLSYEKSSYTEPDGLAGTKVTVFEENPDGTRNLVGTVNYSWVVFNYTGGENGLYRLTFIWRGDIPLYSIYVENYVLRKTSSTGSIVDQGTRTIYANGQSSGSRDINTFHTTSNIETMYMRADRLTGNAMGDYIAFYTAYFTQVITVN